MNTKYDNGKSSKTKSTTAGSLDDISGHDKYQRDRDPSSTDTGSTVDQSNFSYNQSAESQPDHRNTDDYPDDDDNRSNQESAIDSAFDTAVASFSRYPLLFAAAAFAVGAILAGRKSSV